MRSDTPAKFSRLANITFDELYPPRLDVTGPEPHQRGLCRCGCGTRLEKKQRFWAKGHGLEAVHKYEFAKGYSKAIRRAVKARDQGVCAMCRLDVDAIRKQCFMEPGLRLLDPRKKTREERRALEAAFARAREVARDWAFRHGFPSPSVTWWQADHIIPLVEGGAHTMENLRTLCVPCHKTQTAALAARRAAARKPRHPLVANLPQAPMASQMALTLA